MELLLNELRQLERRAIALSEMGESSSRNSALEQQAMEEYRNLKGEIGQRAKEADRYTRNDVSDWAINTFASALRKAHIAMRAPTSTSPRNQSWISSVQDLCFELSYYAGTLENGMKKSP